MVMFTFLVIDHRDCFGFNLVLRHSIENRFIITSKIYLVHKARTHCSFSFVVITRLCTCIDAFYLTWMKGSDNYAVQPISPNLLNLFSSGYLFTSFHVRHSSKINIIKQMHQQRFSNYAR